MRAALIHALKRAKAPLTERCFFVRYPQIIMPDSRQKP